MTPIRHNVVAGLQTARLTLPSSLWPGLTRPSIPIPIGEWGVLRYILASKKRGTLYVGVTNDIARRAYEHRVGTGNSVFRLV